MAVEDDGPGVAGGERARIFERFARGSAARHRIGTGLGLALVAEHAAAQGGEAWVEDRPGGGARFVVGIPTGVRRERAAPRRARGRDRSRSLARGRAGTAAASEVRARSHDDDRCSGSTRRRPRPPTTTTTTTTTTTVPDVASSRRRRPRRAAARRRPVVTEPVAAVLPRRRPDGADPAEPARRRRRCSRVLDAPRGRPTGGEAGVGLRTALPRGVIEHAVRSPAAWRPSTSSPEVYERIRSDEELPAIAQIVLTLTRQSGIGQVLFTLDGAPMPVVRRGNNLRHRAGRTGLGRRVRRACRRGPTTSHDVHGTAGRDHGAGRPGPTPAPTRRDGQ